MNTKAWIEAARPRTLPTSVSPVIAATAYAWAQGVVNWYAASICFIFALLAQRASNFGNDYFDYVKGTDKVDRDGPRRAVTAGDISPRAMLTATLVTLGLACAIGCLLIPFGGVWLIAAGIAIAIAALAYSAGPFPLSHHGLGDITVWTFFGLVAVNLTYYVQAHTFDSDVALCSAAMGLLSVNILMVNNYRDYDDDKAVGKRTTVVLFGRRFALVAYWLNGAIALLCVVQTWRDAGIAGIVLLHIYVVAHLKSCRLMRTYTGSDLNKVLGMTARNQLIFTLLLVVAIILSQYPIC